MAVYPIKYSDLFQLYHLVDDKAILLDSLHARSVSFLHDDVTLFHRTKGNNQKYWEHADG